MNPRLAEVLSWTALFEGEGGGIPKTIEDCKENDAQIPKVVQSDGFVIITIWPSRMSFASQTSPRLPQVAIAKLPSTSPDLFGRKKELAMLDKAWQDGKFNIVSLVAFGGVGKTALVNYWLNHNMAGKNYDGARCVFGWSFYSQGASVDKQASADHFIDSALRFFGDPEPTKGSPWDKAVRLAQLVQKRKTLLVLDGLEPIQNPLDKRIKDPSVASLLRSLAAQNTGLCVITTRLDVIDLQDFSDTSAKTIDLEDLSPQAGCQLLKKAGVDGTDAELEKACKEYAGHALALTLLASYLKIPTILDQKQGAHARKVMAAYENYFEDKPELYILYTLGLFDRPADTGPIEALKAEPPIEGLTSKLSNLSDAKWQFALDNLRELRLLAPEDANSPGTLDAHPLMREYFGDKLRQTSPDVWKTAHYRLYEYYKSTAKDLPDTIEEMTPLYQAVTHGCNAGLYQQAYDDVYWRRIQREDEYFNWRKLGAFGAELAVISGFFESPWQQPVANLSDPTKGLILNSVSYCLRAIGRLTEAVQPFKAALDIGITQKDWENATVTASNLSGLYLALGKLPDAIGCARQSIEFANKSSNEFWRMGSRTTLADALHYAGRLAEAEDLFSEAEKIQKDWQPQFPLLYSVRGFQYCYLLLGRGKYEKVLNRAAQTLEIATQNEWLLDIALDHLSLGRAFLLKALNEKTGDYTPSAEHLNEAVAGLRKAARQDYLPRGLLTRAEFYRVTKDFESAKRDLDETFNLAARCGMKLFEADSLLEYTRLYLAQKDKKSARENFAKAKALIDEIGYHRRDNAVSDLEQKLG
jgi:tetratricopeptide (TPR) repeat protein